ncbi:MAG: ComF family protein [Chloroflexota bacterium]|nr:ComF family protein [Chloroflexota bacterium]MDE2960554.1 ComF family protein [Chloroflexota bacterium]
MSLMRRLAPVRGLAEQAGRTLLDALYPLECAGCGGSGKIICDRCAQELPWLVPPCCRVCAAHSEFELCQACAQSGRRFDGVRAPYRYEGSIRQAILALKYGGIKAAAPQLGDMLAEYLKGNPLPGDLMAPVPMHASRRRERGYNQAELLARRVAGRCDVPYYGELLARTRRVDPQAGMTSAVSRAANVADSVAVSRPNDVDGAQIILVDDVATTGSTLEVCAAALKDAGAVSVWCLTLAVAGNRRTGE